MLLKYYHLENGLFSILLLIFSPVYNFDGWRSDIVKAPLHRGLHTAHPPLAVRGWCWQQVLSYVHTGAHNQGRLFTRGQRGVFW